MQEEKIEQLLLLADELRGTSHNLPELSELIHEAKQRGIEVTIEDVHQLLKNRKTWSLAFTMPEFVSGFIVDLMDNRSVDSVLDIWAGFGYLSSMIEDERSPSSMTSFEENERSYRIAQELGLDSKLNIHLGEPLLLLDEVEGPIDVIIGTPPFNYRGRTKAVIDTPTGPVDIQDYTERILIAKAATKLDQKGIGIFVVSQNFVWDRAGHRLISQLGKLGLQIDAIFYLAPGTFSPETSIPSLLLILKKGEQENVFVGELSPYPESQAELLHNWQNKQPGRIPQHGILVELESFISFEQVILEREIVDRANELMSEIHPLADLAFEINLAEKEKSNGFVEKPNALYLPLLGTSPAIISVEEFQLKPQNYAQIVIDPNKAVAIFVAEFLNSELGWKIRNSLSVGYIPKMSKGRILSAKVILPGLDDQTTIIQLQRELSELSSRVSEFQDSLWIEPDQARLIRDELGWLIKEESFLAWLDSLPFPLASILWTYHAASILDRKANHLFHFFEALTQFIVTILISAYAANKEFYDRESIKWLSSEAQYEDWYRKASWGNWLTVGRRLAKNTRRYLSDKEYKDLCEKLYGYPHNNFLRMITSKKLFAVLEEAKIYRDSYKGHDPIAGDTEKQRQLTLLRASLATTRKIISNRFSTTKLISPRSSKYEDGIFLYQVKDLVGTRTPFKTTVVETTVPLDVRKLYVYHLRQFEPMELLPYFRLMESPKTQQNACYFYSRLEDGDEVRWVTYHFEDEPVIIRIDHELIDSLSFLRPIIDQ